MRIIIECPENDSPLRGRIHLRGLSFAQLQTSCSSVADHTLSEIALISRPVQGGVHPLFQFSCYRFVLLFRGYNVVIPQA